METDYSKREVDILMKELHEKLDLILTQTTRTNGRVTDCEKEISDIKGWKQYIVGGIAIASVLGLPLLTYNLYQTIETSKALVAHMAR